MAKRYLIPKSGISGIRPVTRNGVKWANLSPKGIRPTVLNKICMVVLECNENMRAIANSTALNCNTNVLWSLRELPLHPLALPSGVGIAPPRRQKDHSKHVSLRDVTRNFQRIWLAEPPEVPAFREEVRIQSVTLVHCIPPTCLVGKWSCCSVRYYACHDPETIGRQAQHTGTICAPFLKKTIWRLCCCPQMPKEATK